MRINKMITKRKYFDLLSNSLNSFFKEIYRDRLGEFVFGYWDLKGEKSLCSKGSLRHRFPPSIGPTAISC